jgi:hypothetical protein
MHKDDLAVVMAFGERILRQPMEVIAGVEETLHDFVLFAMGHPE